MKTTLKLYMERFDSPPHTHFWNLTYKQCNEVTDFVYALNPDHKVGELHQLIKASLEQLDKDRGNPVGVIIRNASPNEKNGVILFYPYTEVELLTRCFNKQEVPIHE